ncbi:hypothetical protein X895_2436 [Burkholderia pseudomallei MSHR4503]|nr:hypothetical protein X895_2436 [Burkholderia pseudomallei MSHR4503]
MSGLRAARRRGVAVMNAKSPGGAPGFRLLTNPRQVGGFCFLMA